MPTSDPAHPVELGKWRRDLDSYTNDVKLVEAGGRRYALIVDGVGCSARTSLTHSLPRHR